MWSNGDALTADDFVWSWMRILTPSLGSQYPDMLNYVKDAAGFHQGKADDFSTVGVKAINDHELRVELKKIDFTCQNHDNWAKFYFRE